MKIWEPLVRLCYLAYLVHPIVMYTFNMNMQQTIMVNHWIMVTRVSFKLVLIVVTH